MSILSRWKKARTTKKNLAKARAIQDKYANTRTTAGRAAYNNSAVGRMTKYANMRTKRGRASYRTAKQIAAAKRNLSKAWAKLKSRGKSSKDSVAITTQLAAAGAYDTIKGTLNTYVETRAFNKMLKSGSPDQKAFARFTAPLINSTIGSKSKGRIPVRKATMWAAREYTKANIERYKRVASYLKSRKPK